MRRPRAKASSSRMLHYFANPGRFQRSTRRLAPWLMILGAAILLPALLWGLVFSPPDWQQGETVKIMYVHVPFAWLASMTYASLAVCGLLSIVWRHPLADLAAGEIAPVGAILTAGCLITGSLWGIPTWGTWWVWDARLTSVLILFFLFVGHIVLYRGFDDEERGVKAAAILSLLGAINLPIIKFSVDWWNTLHQPASITLTAAPKMPMAMLAPLLISFLGLSLLTAGVILTRLRAAVLENKLRSARMAHVLVDAR